MKTQTLVVETLQKEENVMVYFDRGRRMLPCAVDEVAEVVERLLSQNYTVTSAENLNN